MSAQVQNHNDAIRELQDLLGERLSLNASVLDQHSHDEAYATPAQPDAVVFPESTTEVSEIVKVCARHGCPIVPYGVGTSLEGHVIPIHGGITVDTSRMNQVIELHAEDLDVVVQPGVTRRQLNTELKDTGLMFPIDPGADATLGGMAATRASGTNAVRYGTMRENVLAMEVVLADGRIIKTGSRARKSSAGYDLTHLLVGSEGTLGIITELTVKLYGRPEAMSSATVAFDSISGAVDAVILAIQSGLPMARIELLDELQVQAINDYHSDFDFPIKPHLFLEFHGTEAYVKEQTESFKAISDEYGGSEFQWATKTEDRNRLWRARHDAFYACKALRPGADGIVTDCCVPISALAECIATTKAEIERLDLVAPLVGHVGDGNFHLIVLVEPGNVEERAKAEQLANTMNHLAISQGGTVSGEHGIGTGKKKYMQKQHGDAYFVMSQIKRSLDPQNIMNPGKIVTIN
ncbi:MAG: FAD-binding protein [Gammaproteobacteria bacterium]|nr:FAD-binding protein [Gammaproteobacteria bacterium]